MAEKKEERKISPAIAIIPVGFGLAALGAIAMAALAKAAPGLANLYGKVTDSSTGAAIAGVTVTIDSKTTTTDSTGAFGFSGLAPGTYVMTFEKEGYTMVTGHDITLVAGLNELNVSLTPTAAPPATATLYGTVTDAETGLPLVGVIITVDGSLVQYTDSSGYYIFSGLAVGSHSVKFEKAGYNTETR